MGVQRRSQGATAAMLLLAAMLISASVSAAEQLCADVKIEILQQLTLERQGFEADQQQS